ncbi:tetratricopeptide repeat protein [Candidatus Magnetomonas plexicatena]|uniref:tetratricopeptide repeat protein n=1 Tax=Candidatus Magnetomonas plexicatena TaxID=2552947 RepID=UPI001C740C83|nr:tetratricopeptide repeat protein [Nitrospirales bacterium LBB_01]
MIKKTEIKSFSIKIGVISVLTVSILTLYCYWGVWNFDFVVYDDPLFVTSNIFVKSGLNAESLKWAFTSFDDANWIPLTRLSFFVHIHFLGVSPGGFHLENLVLHVISSSLLFLFLFRSTGLWVESAAVSLLFALHPMNVESVSWIAERKGVLSGFFWMLTLVFYFFYNKNRFVLWYLAVTASFMLALMSKPSAVTLPVVLLLMDFWPLRRLTIHGIRLKSSVLKNALYEKIPLFTISIAMSAMAVISQKSGGAMVSLTELPLVIRVENAVLNYFQYFYKMFVPLGLAVIYPNPHPLPILTIALTLLFFMTITIASVLLLKRYPLVIVGWIWFVVTLLPVIGLVSVGSQNMSDRYSYIPYTGLFIALIFGGSLAIRHRSAKAFAAVIVSLFLVFLIQQTKKQVSYWQDSVTLFTHTNALIKNNEKVCLNLGLAYLNKGDYLQAVANIKHASELNPLYTDVYLKLGFAYASAGLYQEAAEAYKKALSITPGSYSAFINLGYAYLKSFQFENGHAAFKEALRLNSDSYEAYNGLGLILLNTGKPKEAAVYFQKALSLNPLVKEVQENLKLSVLMSEKGQ